VPLLSRIYPNGLADVNHFHAAGGMGFLIGQLLDAGLLHRDVRTIAGEGGLERYREEPFLDDGTLAWKPGSAESLDDTVLAPVAKPFSANGGLKLLSGNLGRAVMKISAVKPDRHVIEAPALVFHDQNEMQDAFKRGKLNRDFVAVIRFQGPKSNGMPELHKLTPALGVLQDKGFKVALVTDGRMSGASGKVPAAIHLTPEAADGGAIAKIRDGDIIRVDAGGGLLDVRVSEAEWAVRQPVQADLSHYHQGLGRELFAPFRAAVGRAEEGAAVVGQLVA
jgi:phosphogluconate dehydratase